MIRIEIEDGSGFHLLEDGGYLLLELDWLAEPEGDTTESWLVVSGAPANSWSEISPVGQSWSNISSAPANSWTEVTDQTGENWTPVTT